MNGPPSQRIWRDPALLLILAGALLLRVYLAATLAYVHDEVNTSIPLSDTISFMPGQVSLPLRGENHGALPAYLVKLSGAVFGTTALGYRTVHVLLGLTTILLVYLLARQWAGVVAARWAAALLAFNEYFLAVSSRATAHVPHLFFVTAAVFAFARFLALQRLIFLYLAGASVGLAFYSKEHSALLVPVFFLTLLHPRHRLWLRSRHVYLAGLMFALVISPDILWNLRADPETARVTYSDQPAAQATYTTHLRRIGGLGLSPYPLMFYAKTPVEALSVFATGREIRDETPEYPSVNAALGLLLLAWVVGATLNPAPADALRPLLLTWFWGVFGFFTFIARGDPPGRLDPVSWIWVETTMVAAVVMAGSRLADATSEWRALAWASAAAMLLFATADTVLAMTGALLGGLRSMFDALSHLLQVLAIETVAIVRSHPLRIVALAVLGGVAAGWLLAAVRNRIPRSRGPEGWHSVRGGPEPWY